MAPRAEEKAHLSGQPMGGNDYEAATEAVESRFEVLGRTLGPGMARFRCASCSDPKSRFDGLLEDLSGTELVPIMSEEGGALVVEVGRGGKPEEDKGPTKKHTLLFLATILTTLWIGAQMFGVKPLSNPFQLWKGWPYTVAIMAFWGYTSLGTTLCPKREESWPRSRTSFPSPSLLGRSAPSSA